MNAGRMQEPSHEICRNGIIKTLTFKLATCMNTSTDHKEGVTQTEEEGGKVNVPEGMEGRELREYDHDHRHHRDEVIQSDGAVRRKV